TFTPTVTGLVYDTLRFTWSGHADSVILRGVGTDSGLQLSAVGLDFGSVHVGTDSTMPLYLFARNNFPTIDSIRIGTIADTFSDTTNPGLPYTIQNDSDTLAVSVTYHAHLEQADTDSLVIYSGSNSWVVPLTARGVEAHPRVNATLINFDTVVLGKSITIQPVRLTNAGEYQLFVNSLTSDSIFRTTPDLPTVAIAPDSSRLYSITFRPVRARTVIDTLQFTTSSPDPVPPVLLIGTGVYPTGIGPSFGYSVASINTEPGEFDTIPISMSGIRLAKIDADSAVLDIRFDPEMVRMMGADGGADTTRFTFLNDSTAEVSVIRNTFGDGTIVWLHTEALLGPHPLSYIHVLNADPAADQPEAAGDGKFFVADCGGAIHGVVFAGPYTTSAIVPNPAGDQAQLQFTLGLDGPVAVDIYNSIGQLVKHLAMGSLKAGAHSSTLDVSDLPQGRYVYRLSSLEYHAEGAMVIMR
ncbi:MAG: T9SS type A sorting domain-containing protein, partial [Candidatus Kapaibacterium sp.]